MEKNLYEAIKDRKQFLPEKRVKNWIYQVLKALDFMHRNGIFHRDIKPENILLRDDNVKLADLGSCKGIYNKPPFTEYISTRWYRSPECLLTDGYYNYKMDIWGLGCVFFEMLTLAPLFPGDNEIDQVNKINEIIGSPSNELYQRLVQYSAHSEDFDFDYQKGTGFKQYLRHVSNECIDLIKNMLIYDANKRYTAKQCLSHVYFKDLVEQELKLSKMSLINFRQNLNNAMIMSMNDSSFIKNDESPQLINIKTVGKNNNNDVYLPEIKMKKSHNEVSKYDDSPPGISSKRDFIYKLPIIGNKFKLWGESNFINSNDFKRSMRQNLSKDNIEKMINTQYDKKNSYNAKKTKEFKKNYVSPYSRKTIANNFYL
jgi:renal tumor antigen